MAVTVDIVTYYAGEAVTIDIQLLDPDGMTPVAAPEGYAVALVLSATGSGPALGGVEYPFTLREPEAAVFRRTLSPADLAGVTPGRSCHYNVWATRAGEAPELRARGRLVLGASIDPP